MADRKCEKCNIFLVKRPRENGTSWKRRRFCSKRCARLGTRLSEIIISRIKRNRKGKGIGNTNGLGKNLGNKNAFGKVIGSNNGNYKGGTSILYKPNREKIAGRKKPEQCEVCGSIGNICFDHDHKTGKFRGWICSRCNLALGLVKDTSETLIALAEYLKRNGNLPRY